MSGPRWTEWLGRRALLALALTLCVAGCKEESTEPQDNSLQLPELTSPENVISAIEMIYNDGTHPASDRLGAYASLFDSAFVFHLQPSDIGLGLPPTWGIEDELSAHEIMFGAQADGDIYSMELRIVHDPASDLTPPEVGREGWQEVFATNVYLRLMFNAYDGLEVNGQQAKFKFPPARDGRFWIADWTDLPRPALLARSAVAPTTWGNIKARFR